MSEYETFMKGKRREFTGVGINVPVDTISDQLFDFQRDIVRWALAKGRACVFAGTGLGKTAMQVEWARIVHEHTGQDVLILAPLAVAQQTVREGAKFGVTVTYCRDQSDVRTGVNVTNYERLHLFDADTFVGVVLDESSILKSFSGATRNEIITSFSLTPFRLACTATPAPNDYMELGNHAEFCGVMSRTEMLAMYFVHDGGETQSWRLKGHAETEFWRWVCSWAVMLGNPSDLGYDGSAFDLPSLTMHHVVVESTEATPGMLFAVEAQTLSERRQARRASLRERVQRTADLVNVSHGILSSTGSVCDKLAACGSQNTPNADELSTTPMQTNGRDGSHSRAHQKKTANTCASTTNPTKNNTRSTNATMPTSATGNDASATPAILSSESDVKNSHAIGIRDESETHDFGQTSESAPLNTTHYSRNKTDDARSVDPIWVMERGEGSPSTIAIRPAQCADFSVPLATSGLANSETTPRSCNAQSPTSPSNQPLEAWVIWCDLNDEQRALERAFGDRAISVHGSLPAEEKEARLWSWLNGDRPILICKPSIAGFGINMQHCANVAFVGLSDSWEQYYQAIRRCWRFGQTREVNCYVVTSQAEGAVVANIERKERDAARMLSGMLSQMADLNRANLTVTERSMDEYTRDEASGNGWRMILADCVDAIREMDSASVDFSVFSPPFASLYTYSNSPRDMGNCATHSEFYEHFTYLVQELYRVLKSGRLVSFHCMNLPTSKSRDGVIGIRDFRGELIRMFESAGFIYHSEVCIWKDPVTAMQRTKAIGLLYKQLKKDSHLSRQGIADYLVTMRKPGDNPEPITKSPEDFPVDLWQRYASPVWFDINPSDTLQRESAREERDERHIAPLQLEVIRRAVQLWTNPDDLVLSPFAGIGSEGYVSIQEGRRFVGIELKRSYWTQAVANLERAVFLTNQPRLFVDDEVA